jgi:type 1 glutamine amidotransferase
VNAPRLLVFTKTQAFRHASIPAARASVQLLACQRGWRVDFTEDSADFTSANLAHYAAVMFLLTTGNVLDDAQKSAFEGYIRSGGGFVGVHSASDTEYGWAWYDGLVGAHNNVNNKHSAVVQGTIVVVDRTHISTSMLPARWTRTDEWYNFATNPRPFVHVLMTMDETTYKGGTMGADHPIAWYHGFDGGRAWYTALGHTIESYSEPLFLAHLAGGITYAMGQTTSVPITPPAVPCATATSPAAVIAPSYCGGDMPAVALADVIPSWLRLW